jgi:hypothetical protein
MILIVFCAGNRNRSHVRKFISRGVFAVLLITNTTHVDN